jgi:hypothetical protein
MHTKLPFVPVPRILPYPHLIDQIPILPIPIHRACVDSQVANKCLTICDKAARGPWVIDATKRPSMQVAECSPVVVSTVCVLPEQVYLKWPEGPRGCADV